MTRPAGATSAPVTTPSANDSAKPRIAVSGVRSSCDTDSRNSRCLPSLRASASASSFTAPATSAISLGPCSGTRTSRCPPRSRCAAAAVRRNGRASSVPTTPPTSSAVATPTSTAKPMLRRTTASPAGTVSAERTSANAPERAGRASTNQVAPAASTTAETGVPCNARSAPACRSAEAVGSARAWAVPPEDGDGDALALQDLHHAADAGSRPDRAGPRVVQLGGDDVGLLGQHVGGDLPGW